MAGYLSHTLIFSLKYILCIITVQEVSVNPYFVTELYRHAVCEADEGNPHLA